MGRPALSLATPGKIRLWKELNGSWTARCLYRDIDGRSRLVERSRPTRASAERALKEALRDRSRLSPDAEIGPETRVAVVAAQWWSDFEQRSTSAGTLRLYRGRLDNLVLPALGQLRICELKAYGDIRVGLASRSGNITNAPSLATWGTHRIDPAQIAKASHLVG